MVLALPGVRGEAAGRADAGRSRLRGVVHELAIELAPILAAQHLQATPIATRNRRAQVWLLR